MEMKTIALTDPKPLPKDDRCPTCKAGKAARVRSCGFGEAHPVCGRCGYEWRDETWEGQ